jgi:hypothetical protein
VTIAKYFDGKAAKPSASHIRATLDDICQDSTGNYKMVETPEFFTMGDDYQREKDIAEKAVAESVCTSRPRRGQAPRVSP